MDISIINIKISPSIYIMTTKSKNIDIDKYFYSAMITKKCQLPINKLNSNVKETIFNKLKTNFEGKCSNEGFIQQNSINIINLSIGHLQEIYVNYDVTFECKVCYPTSDLLVECTIDNITKAGVKASLSETNNPLVIFAARDLHLENDEFNSLEVSDNIVVKILGTRFEIGDKYIAAIAEYVKKQ